MLRLPRHGARLDARTRSAGAVRGGRGALLLAMAALSLGVSEARAADACAKGPALPAAREGALAYNKSDHLLYLCKGTSWVALGS